MGTIILGTAVASAIYDDIKSVMQTTPYSVHLRGVIVGDDAASIAYQNLKERACERCEFAYSRRTFSNDIHQAALRNELQHMNQDADLTGIIIQLPLPSHIDRDTVLKVLDQHKDVDAFFYTSARPNASQTSIRPPTPLAMLKLFEATGQTLDGKRIVIVGNGFLVGRPLAMMLRDQGIEALVIDLDTRNRLEYIKQAEVLFTGVGQANVITPNMIADRVTIIDAGYTRINGKTYGDVDERCIEKALFMTPATGGVGPLTVACLMQNALESAQLQERMR